MRRGGDALADDARAEPGAGASIACFMGYNNAKQFSKHKEDFGHSSIEGVCGSEAANNAVTGGSLIPMLTLGIPGESVTAVLMGGLVIQGLAPGPELFTKHADMTYTFFAGFVLVQFFMLAIGMLGCRGFAQISRLSDAILIPLRHGAVLCRLLRNSQEPQRRRRHAHIRRYSGYLMRKFDLNTAAVVLALILGPISEKGAARRARESAAAISAACSRSPVSWVLIILSVIGIFSPILMAKFEKKVSGGEVLEENKIKKYKTDKKNPLSWRFLCYSTLFSPRDRSGEHGEGGGLTRAGESAAYHIVSHCSGSAKH